MTENKRFIYNKFDIVGNFEENELKLYEIDNNPSDDLDESNLFYVYSNSEVNIESIVDKLNTLVDENDELKQCLEEMSSTGSYWWFKEYKRVEKENEKLKIDLGIAEDNHKMDREIIDDIHNEYQRVKKENEQLKTQIKIFEKFLDENNLDIDWELFCTVDECKKDSDDYGCKECKYLGDVE